MVQSADRRRLTVEPLEGYAPEVARALWGMVDTRRRTLRTLEGVSDEVLDWSPPYDAANSIGTLLYHLADVEASWLFRETLEVEPWPDEVATLFPHVDRDDAGVLTVVAGLPMTAHLDRLADVRSMLLESLREMTAADYRRPREPEAYDVTPEWVLHHLMQHEAEHRGQIGEVRVAYEAR